ncbi:MAG: hypothetical protein H9535_21900 [Ignavibacteria bacterium]|nr:hypothetical protein [Ignavibacteria bacterium]
MTVEWSDDANFAPEFLYESAKKQISLFYTNFIFRKYMPAELHHIMQKMQQQQPENKITQHVFTALEDRAFHIFDKRDDLKKQYETIKNSYLKASNENQEHQH